MGTLGHWRKRVPGFSIIAHPLYSLLQKGKLWKWDPEHEQAVKTLIQEWKPYWTLGSVPPHDSITVEWGFAEDGTYCNLFQTGPDGPKRPLLFIRTAFKETEQRYSEWEKGLLSSVPAVKQVELLRGNPSRKTPPSLVLFSFPGTILGIIPTHLPWRSG